MMTSVRLMTTDELRDRIARYDRERALSTADWVIYEACRRELRRRLAAAA